MTNYRTQNYTVTLTAALVLQGSIPWAYAGLNAFMSLVITRINNFNLSELPKLLLEVRGMSRTVRLAKAIGLSVLPTVWAIGTSYVAGSLPASVCNSKETIQ